VTPLLRALIPPFVRALSGLKLGRPRLCRPAAASAGSGARQKQTDAVKRSPARRRIDAPGETPQLNLTLPWCAAAQQLPPRSLDPRFIPTSAVDRPTLTHAQPIDHSKNQDPKSRPPLCPTDSGMNAANGMHRAHSLSSQLFPYCLWEPAHSLWARVNRDYRTPTIQGLAMFWITRPSPDPLAADPNLAAKYHRGAIPLQDFFWPTPKISVTQPKTLFPVRIIPPKRGFKAAMLLPSPATGWPKSNLSLRAYFHIDDCRIGTYAPALK
jgi:hypothetical protein